MFVNRNVIYEHQCYTYLKVQYKCINVLEMYKCIGYREEIIGTTLYTPCLLSHL